jgi:cyclase
MLTKRIIAALDIQNLKVVKGIKFQDIKEVGDPIELSKRYEKDGIDEIVFLDISASLENRNPLFKLIEKISENLNIPFTVGGGINSLKDIITIINKGADKVFINTAAVLNPDLIKKSVKILGSANICIAIDSKKENNGEDYVYIKGGSKKTDIKTLEWIKYIQNIGAGEVIITSMDHDGVQTGYGCELIKKINEVSTIPVIASGGAGKIKHFYDVFESGADGALAASIFHYEKIPIYQLKKSLKEMDVNVRI